MKGTHELVVLVIGAATLTSADAFACSPIPNGWYGEFVEFETKGEVAQSANIVVTEYYLEEGARLEISEPAGGLATTLAVVSRQRFREAGFDYEPERVVYRPDTPLAPGTYTLHYVMPTGEIMMGSAQATITVLDELPPAGPPAPTVSWRVVAYDGPEDEPLFVEQGPCGPLDWADTSLYRHAIVAEGPDQPPGYITLEVEGIGRMFSTPLAGALEVDVVLGSGEAFVQCVSAIHTDIYGQSSEPTRICQPDQCAAKHRNDRGDVWGGLSQDCADWSPGYADRNAEGCACAQAPGAPAGSHGALALLALGLLGVRRRR